MAQGDYYELHKKRKGLRLDHEERKRKKAAREIHKQAKFAKTVHGIRAKLYNQKRYKEKATLRKKIKVTTEKQVEHSAPPNEEALPAYLLDREEVTRSKVLSNTLKQLRKEKAGKWSMPIQSVKAISDQEMFRVLKTGKRRKSMWKRVVTKPTFVGQDFTRKPPKYERFIRPMALRFKKANVTHPELKTTFQLDILGVKKNPSSPLYTSLGILTKGTIIEVNVSELSLVTQSGKVIWGKYAQITNHPENDGCVNAVLIV
ncbi:putative ribosome biogenesis protein N [Monocercomonoides exilis]|uniref:putative ribosome biogenesis protein N n=1 Tax=Monocercomonoides exilis TaxID=2049356 RepID=UPI00355A836B|nr:putative ribosome biogenesis protein N [Monocercomonoides exilis]|eukprot:MONOS_2410.1-p1 / transcript=MONOS_2410.1 / gene=MONOS_2410 / organism=Monocercomonoides_exilis_PA203 / gene_product=ribosome biogenesis protein N / transcript_product=ribosome biogenesis protein N / location=Mono_scaffold00049:141254-142576(+) / protein_length=258 / sequence_SO=supercontig / SO=protein_coding / is_pseudo=false